METKKDIYHLWVQYTTKNDEQYFRQFIKGFVTIWDSQLKLNWENPTHWKELKHDAGPCLSRLPEELLPAISKFVFIAQDQINSNQISNEGLQQIDLLIRCLIIICRNLDNIPLVASCDYVGHAVSIATVIIQKLVEGETNFGQYGVSFIFSTCHLLECLYDPYFSWRHFLNSNTVDFSQLLFQPALLHVEVIPFIYGCFETNLVEVYPELSCELLHVLGAIISGAQRMVLELQSILEMNSSDNNENLNEGHNSLRAVCPATVKLVMTIISKGTAPDKVHNAALNCFVMMVRVLMKSAPDQRQIEISTLISLYNSAVISVFDHLAQDSSSSQQMLCRMIIAYRNLIDGKNSKLLLVENQVLDTVVKFLEFSEKLEVNKQQLAAECVTTFTIIIQGNPLVLQNIKQSGLFNKFIRCVENLGKPSRDLLINMLNMVCEEELGECITKDVTIRNSEALLAVAKWFGKVNVDDQLWLANVLNQLCTCNLQSKIVSCSVGLFAVICEVLKTENSIHFQTLHVLIELLQSLAMHSITSYELKQLFLLLRNDTDEKVPLKTGLIRALCAISRKNDALECKSYFDIQSETDFISVPNIKKWPAAGYGFTFYTWVRLGSRNHFPNNESYRRQLFSISTSIGTGMQIFFRADGTVVIGVTTKKEFLTACASDYPILDENWHCLVVSFMAARRHFGHDQVCIYIDGTQRLAVSMKFPSLTESFVNCTIGSVTHHRTTSTHATDKSNDKSQLLPGVLGSGLLPNIINLVPSHFTLPLRSSTPLDSHVKSFPVGMQDSVWGTPTCLFGQIGVVSLFHETLPISQVKALYESGPNLKFLFEKEEIEMTELASKLVFCYTALACDNDYCLDLSLSGKYPAQISAKYVRTYNMKDCINGIGGPSVLLPLLENARKYETVTTFSFSSPTTEQEVCDDWEILPQISQSERKLEKNPASAVLSLVKNLISGHKVNTKNILKDDIVPIMGYLLSKLDPNVIDENVLLGIDLLIKAAKDLQDPALLRNIYQHVLFHFKIWSECHLKISHIQLISTIIKEDRKYLRKKYGVQFFLDTIRMFNMGLELLSNEDSRTIRNSLFGLIRFYIQKEVSVKEVMPILKFLITVKEEIVIMELLEMLITHMDKKSCRDQIFLLMYEPHSAELLYALLIDKEFSMELKQKVLRFLSLLLRSERVYERHKTRLRLQDGSVIGNSNGMYLGLVSYLNEQVLSMEVVVMLMEQLLMTDANNNYSGALMLLNVLSLADLDIKLEVAKKVLTTTFMKPQAPQLFAKQTAWQDSIARLLIKCPINVTEKEPEEAFPDLMTFEDEMKDEPSLNLFTSTALVLENKVTENINNAADNITSAVASVYSAFKQKTVEMQDTLEDAKSRITKRASLMSVSEGYSEMESPLPSPHLQRKNKSELYDNSNDSSSNEDLSTPSPRVTNTTPSHRSLTFTEDESEARGEDLDEMDSVDDLIREWKALDAEKESDREEELCYLVVNILFTVLWRGVEGYSKESWKERGQVMACINLLALNNELYISHLSLKLRILEMAVQASLSDLRDTSQNVTAHSENASQLMRWVYDLVVLDPNEDIEKKASVKLLDSVLALLDALIVFQDPPAEEWVDMARLALGILLNCANSQNIEMCAMATAKLHSLLQTRSIKDMEEGGYMLYMVNKGITSTLQAETQERYSFLMPVVKTLLEKLSSAFYYSTVLPDLPPLTSGPAFFENFRNYCKSDQWTIFIDKRVRPLHDAYKTSLQGQLIETMNIFWAECYESCKLSVAKRSREVAESRARFHSQVLVPFRLKQQEEISRYNNQLIQDKNRRLVTRNLWRQRKRYLMGDRGPWKSSVGDEQHWKLSHHENYSRMRLKLTPNMHFDSHVNASNLRDNTGWMSRMQSVEDMTLPLSLPVIVKNDAEDDIIPEDDFRFSIIPEFDAFDGGKEKMMLSEDCELVTLMSVVKGRLDITTSHVYFYDLSPVKDEVDRQDFKWPFYKLREVHLRQYNLRRSALEFFLIDQTNYFINFSMKTRNRVLSCIYSSKPPNLLCNGNRSPGEMLRTSGLTQKWVNREISNFDYLMHLNTIAGRSYNDLSQYPVFPWILADYTSEVLDLNDPATFRDLSKPIGVVNPKNEAEVRAKYENFEDPTGTIAKFHYGTHYSNSAGVLHYLVRVEPFTSLHIELQSGRFDVADRQFHSIPQTWKLLMDNPNDVKELTPEFFYFPEFLKNLNKFDLGLLQGTKERVDDVILPKWATSAEDFIYKHRKALESEHVSLNLHHWIDLIFGCKQKGPKAVEALNVFYYCSYEGAVDLDSIKNQAEREAVEGMINNFGQTPRQLMKDPHPQRLSWEDALAKMIKNELRKPDLTLFLDNIRSFTVEVTNDKDPIIYISTPRSQPRGGFHLVDAADTVVSVTKTGVIGCHSWLPYEKHSYRSFVFDVDPSHNNTKTRKKVPDYFHPSITLGSHLFALSLDAKLLFTGGHWDSSLQIYSISKNKVVSSVISHFDIVTCLSLDQCGLYLITGSRDTTCVIWDVSHICVPNVQQSGSAPKPHQILYGHDREVTCVAIMTELDVAVSGSKDGLVNVHTIENGQYIRALYPIDSGPGTEVTFLTLSTHGHIAFSCKDETKHSVHVFSVNGTNLGSKYVAGQVTGLTTAGDCLVIVDDGGDLTINRLLGLHPIYDIPFHVPIQTAVVTNQSTHLIVPLRDGNVVVIGVPNS